MNARDELACAFRRVSHTGAQLSVLHLECFEALETCLITAVLHGIFQRPHARLRGLCAAPESREFLTQVAYKQLELTERK
jgi:hypothetical protein